MQRYVVIDCFPESAARYKKRYVIVAIDVIRATTTLTTALAQGRQVLPARGVDEAMRIASRLREPLLAGELKGEMPAGFEMNNSPSQIARRRDVHRPLVLVSTSGTELIQNARGGRGVYAACFRNLTAVARHLAERGGRVALLGAGSRGQFRREDQMGCAWLAARLVQAGFEPEDDRTREFLDRWQEVSPEEVRFGRSADYLRRSGQTEDLEFVLGHIDDLGTVPVLRGGRFVDVARTAPLCPQGGMEAGLQVVPL